MIEACDSDADIETLRKMIKMQAGEDIKLTRKQMCEAYDNIHASKLPLPPLVMTSDRTYLLDRASPLKHMDYELLFDSSTKRVDLKRIARKVGLTSQIEQMTKKQLVDAIGKRLRYLKVREPVKIVTKRLVVKKEERNVNNTAVNANANRYNNTAVNANANRYNNTAVNEHERQPLQQHSSERERQPLQQHSSERERQPLQQHSSERERQPLQQHSSERERQPLQQHSSE
jgi:hypothetical protein